MINAVFYLLLFWITFKLFRKGSCGIVKGIIAPVIATIGQGFVIIAFFITNEKALLYLLVSITVIAIGWFWNKSRIEKAING